MDDLAGGASARMAAHVAQTRYAHLAPAVIRAFRRALLDHVTCGVAGSAMPVSRALLSYFQENDASRVATVIASGAKLSPAIPEVPTVAEAGVPGFDYATWYGLFTAAALDAAGVCAVRAYRACQVGAGGQDDRACPALSAAPAPRF